MRVLTLTFLALIVAPPVMAQQWSDEQQGLIDHMKMCWTAWVDALADETPDRFFEACPQDENAHFWGTDQAVPGNEEDVRRNWDVIRETDDNWGGLRPIYVNIHGDVAIIHLYGYWRANTPDGLVTSEQKRTEVFQRRNGGWVFLGAQSTPATPADSEPYQ